MPPEYLSMEQTRAIARRFGQNAGSVAGTGSVAGGVDDVAKALRTTDLNVRRLIARGILAATQLGTDGPYCVLPSTLEKYIAAGAPVYDFPPLLDNGRFDPNPDARLLVERFAGTLQTIADQQVEAGAGEAVRKQIADIAAQRRSTNVGQRQSYPANVDLPASVAVTAAVNAPISTNAAINASGEPLSRYGSIGELFVTFQVRAAASTILQAVNYAKNGRSAAQQFYSSSAAYSAVTDAAWATVEASAAASVRRSFPVDQDQPNGSAIGGVSVFFNIPMKQILSTVKRNWIDVLAF